MTSGHVRLIQGGVIPIEPIQTFPTGGFDRLDPKFRGRGHVFPWAKAFVGQAKANLRLQ